MAIAFDPSALASLGRELQHDSAGHLPSSCTTCQPAASDAVSTAVAASFSAWATGLELLIAQSIAQRAAGGLAVATTGTALNQSDLDAATMIASYGQSQPSSTTPVLPAGPDQVPSLPAAPAVPATPTPIPAVTWSKLIHGGPGSRPLRTFATQLRSLAADLETQADATRRTSQGVDANWNAGDQPAGRNLANHALWLSDAANYARTVAESAESAAATVDNARTATPTPERIEALRQEYQSALQKFAASGGVISEPLVAAKSNFTKAQTDAVEAQTTYALAAATDTVAVPPPPPAPPPIVGGQPGTERADEEKSTPESERGDDQPGPIKKKHSERDGSGGAGEQGAESDPATLSESGSVVDPTGDVADGENGVLPADPAAPRSSLTPASDVTANTAGQVLGSILGAVGQSAGGASGMMPAGGGLPLSGLSGIPNLASLGSMPGFGGENMPSSEDLGFDDLGPGDLGTTPASSGGAGGGGGGLPGGPSSSVSAAAPASTFTPPASASPAPSAPATGRVGGPMGGMVPPMMGGMGGGKQAERDTDLFPDKRVVHRDRPNIEAVFGELEQVRKRRGRRKATTTQEETDGNTTE